jgi:hypothetical protein
MPWVLDHLLMTHAESFGRHTRTATLQKTSSATRGAVGIQSLLEHLC